MPSKIEISPSLIAVLRLLKRDERREIGETITRVGETFGAPHVHLGLGLRALGHGLYECRMGLKQRLVFELRGDTLFFHFLGNHDEVRRFLRQRR